MLAPFVVDVFGGQRSWPFRQMASVAPTRRRFLGLRSTAWSRTERRFGTSSPPVTECERRLFRAASFRRAAGSPEGVRRWNDDPDFGPAARVQSIHENVIQQISDFSIQLTTALMNYFTKSMSTR